MKKARELLLMILLAALVVRVVWFAIAPLIPYAISALVLVLIGGMFYFRSKRW